MTRYVALTAAIGLALAGCGGSSSQSFVGTSEGHVTQVSWTRSGDDVTGRLKDGTPDDVQEYPFTGKVDGDSVTLNVTDPSTPDVGAFTATGTLDGERLTLKQGSAGTPSVLVKGDAADFARQRDALD